MITTNAVIADRRLSTYKGYYWASFLNFLFNIYWIGTFRFLIAMFDSAVYERWIPNRGASCLNLSGGMIFFLARCDLYVIEWSHIFVILKPDSKKKPIWHWLQIQLFGEQRGNHHRGPFARITDVYIERWSTCKPRTSLIKRKALQNIITYSSIYRPRQASIQVWHKEEEWF